MYRTIRNIHLFLGLFAFFFLMMYGLSAVQMAHNGWFNLKPSVSGQSYPVPQPVPSDARALARYLMDEHGLRGELAQVRTTGSGMQFRIVRPGTVYQVEYIRDDNEVAVQANVANFWGMLNRIHHIAGLHHEYRLINIWSVFIALVSAGLILIAATGIYLWFKIHTERRVGTILLILSLGYSLTLMVLMRTAG